MTRRPKHRQRGAVAVEALIGLSTMVLMYACIKFVHERALAQVEAFYTARAAAWSSALGGCGGADVSMQGMIGDMLRGELPAPASILGVGTSENQSARTYTTIDRGAQGSATVRVTVPCNTAIGDPADDASGDWLMGLFE